MQKKHYELQKYFHISIEHISLKIIILCYIFCGVEISCYVIFLDLIIIIIKNSFMKWFININSKLQLIAFQLCLTVIQITYR